VICVPGSAARLRSKQHLLDTLVERARDQNAYTRARVMQTWASLAVSRSIDMGHWLCVAELGIGSPPPPLTPSSTTPSGCSPASPVLLYIHAVPEHITKCHVPSNSSLSVQCRIFQSSLIDPSWPLIKPCRLHLSRPTVHPQPLVKHHT